MPNRCIEWTGALDRNGYGMIAVKGKTHRAHRVVWEKDNGPIPKGMHVLHKCDNRKCVNIEHLYIGSNFDNVRDALERKRRPQAITVEQVHEARRMRDKGCTIIEIQQKLELKSYSAIQKALKGVTYGQV